MKRLGNLTVIVVLALSAASCGGGGGSRVITPTQPDPPVTPVDPPPPAPPPPTLTVDRIMAFGDSLTEGESKGQLFAPSLHDHGTAGIPASYPFKLQTILSETYAAQSIRVLNAGVGGERVVGSKARDRLLTELTRYTPDVLLIIHGVNNLNSGDPLMTIVEAVEELLEVAKPRVNHVFLGNLPPQVKTTKATGADRVPAFNRELAAIAREEGATLVDIYSNISTGMLMPDGLHLTETGNQKMAELFYDKLKGRYHRDPVQ